MTMVDGKSLTSVVFRTLHSRVLLRFPEPGLSTSTLFFIDTLANNLIDMLHLRHLLHHCFNNDFFFFIKLRDDQSGHKYKFQRFINDLILQWYIPSLTKARDFLILVDLNTVIIDQTYFNETSLLLDSMYFRQC